MRDINVEDFLKLVKAITLNAEAISMQTRALEKNTEAINRSTNFS